MNHKHEIRSVSIDQLVKDIDKNLFDPSPPFQREKVWTLQKQKQLLQSVFCNRPIPPCNAAVNPETGVYECWEGQQRILTYKEFYEDQFRIPRSYLQEWDRSIQKSTSRGQRRRDYKWRLCALDKSYYYYSDLPSPIQHYYRTFAIYIQYLEGYARQELIEMFKANQTAVNLTPAERFNAHYGDITLVTLFVDKFKPFYKKMHTFYEDSEDRGYCRQFRNHRLGLLLMVAQIYFMLKESTLEIFSMENMISMMECTPSNILLTTMLKQLTGIHSYYVKYEDMLHGTKKSKGDIMVIINLYQYIMPNYYETVFYKYYMLVRQKEQEKEENMLVDRNWMYDNIRDTITTRIIKGRFQQTIQLLVAKLPKEAFKKKVDIVECEPRYIQLTEIESINKKRKVVATAN